MLAKLTVKNQITIPKKIITQLKNVQYFDVDIKDGIVLLKPVKVFKADLQGIRAKIKKLGLSEDCVAEAVIWARSR
ncbi:MAG: AbrB/MazE/SpoVT family DNA-binding domain-containing protein [Thermodesulfobacteriota bacterium]|nr:AbrB/MazE/SpoVT family DNA-binding domain-containing protein [Thermodesulfobacteriota bacterium]